MTDAPERIWVLKIAPAPEVHMSSQALVWTQPASDNLGEDVEYVRADLAKPKVKPLTESDREEIVEAAYVKMREFQRGVRGQTITEWDGIESWVVEETYRRILKAMEENND